MGGGAILRIVCCTVYSSRGITLQQTLVTFMSYLGRWDGAIFINCGKLSNCRNVYPPNGECGPIEKLIVFSSETF